MPPDNRAAAASSCRDANVQTAVAGIVILVGTACSQGAPSAIPTSPDDLPLLRTADSAWMQASLSRDVDRMVGFYTSNAIADLGLGEPSRGAAAITELWTAAYADTAYRLDWTQPASRGGGRNRAGLHYRYLAAPCRRASTRPVPTLRCGRNRLTVDGSYYLIRPGRRLMVDRSPAAVDPPTSQTGPME